jgi:hypothetical protein
MSSLTNTFGMALDRMEPSTQRQASNRREQVDSEGELVL